MYVIVGWRDDLVRGSPLSELSGPAVSGVSCCWAATDMKLPSLPSHFPSQYLAPQCQLNVITQCRQQRGIKGNQI